MTWGTFTLSTFRRVYNDKTGGYLQVGPDGDGLGLIEITSFEGGVRYDSIRMTKEEAELLGLALGEAIRDLEVER